MFFHGEPTWSFLWRKVIPVVRCCRSRPGRRFAAALGTEIDHVIADASHFLQEDAGPQIG